MGNPAEGRKPGSVSTLVAGPESDHAGLYTHARYAISNKLQPHQNHGREPTSEEITVLHASCMTRPRLRVRRRGSSRLKRDGSSRVSRRGKDAKNNKRHEDQSTHNATVSRFLCNLCGCGFTSPVASLPLRLLEQTPRCEKGVSGQTPRCRLFFSQPHRSSSEHSAPSSPH